MATETVGWSCRFAPTPGRSCCTRDAVPLQLRRGADARQQQQLRRVDRAGTDDDLAGRVQPAQLPGCAASTPSARPPCSRMRSTSVSAITTRLGRRSTGCRNARELLQRTPPRWLQVEDAEAVLALAVEVVVALEAGFGRGRDEGARQRVALHRPLHAELASGAVPGGRAAVGSLVRLVERQHVVEAPSRCCPAPPIRRSRAGGRGCRPCRSPTCSRRTVCRAGRGCCGSTPPAPPLNSCCQLVRACGSRKTLPTGSVVFRLSGKRRSDGPASISATRQAGSADSRLASTQPAAPAPMTM